MTTEGKLVKIAENEQKVYKAGKEAIVKIHPEATVSGSYISLNDVSELPHEVKCKISGVADLTKVTVKRCGKNILGFNQSFTASMLGVTVDYDNETQIFTFNGTYSKEANSNNKITLHLKQYMSFAPNVGAGAKITAKAEKVGGSFSGEQTGNVLFVTWDDDASKVGATRGNVLLPDNVFNRSFEVTKTYITAVYFYISNDVTFNNYQIRIQIESGEVATEYEPHNGTTYTPNADGTVKRMESVSPIMNIFTDTEGANIEATYRKSKGMEVEKEQFYNRFRQGIITDSISFEWMTGLGRTNTALIVDGLSDNATGQTLTLNLAGVNKAYETSSGANDGSTSAAFAELVATKPNWTITLI